MKLITAHRVEKALVSRVDATLLFPNRNVMDYVRHRTCEHFLKWDGRPNKSVNCIEFPLLLARVFFAVWDVYSHDHDRFRDRRSIFLVHPELEQLISNWFPSQAEQIRQLNYRFDHHGFT